jgi:hypothetical protein
MRLRHKRGVLLAVAAFAIASVVGGCTGSNPAPVLPTGSAGVSVAATAIAPNGTPTAALSTASVPAEVSPTVTAAVSPSRAPATPKPVASVDTRPKPGGFVWRRGGPTEIGGDILATPGGYLATCAYETGTADQPALAFHACSSKDLLTWTTPPDPALFLNVTGDEFLPYVTIAVKSGYAVESEVPFNNGDSLSTDWYSADGVSWQKGIPPDQTIPDACVRTVSTGTDCLNVEWVVSNPKSGVSLAWFEDGMLVSKNGWKTSTKVTEPYLAEVPITPVAMSDGSWIAACYWLPPLDPNGGVVGDANLSLVASTDGLHWKQIETTPGTDVGDVALVGGRVFATFLDEENQGDQAVYDLYESTDRGKTWLAVGDAAATQVTGRNVFGLGTRVIAMDDELSPIAWIGTP